MFLRKEFYRISFRMLSAAGCRLCKFLCGANVAGSYSIIKIEQVGSNFLACFLEDLVIGSAWPSGNKQS